ncbi:3'-5' exonuclease [Campylobacter sp. faydin G-24]|uniref:3'-5' exonuclease n=1 Tax=Campylobacter anatolicus TaxID=2829105 RepID=A0ABS5HGN0_9BACT|nr:3'-5' exonuclease [Campylobacter anatolicus]MBR8463431.1 3'-5' exonuclease [Campylobacter anatolicus]
MARNYICVFDCETIPDAELVRKIYGFNGDDKTVSLQAFSAQKEVSGSEFLPIMFHKVVAISAVMADEYGKFLRVSTMEGDSEREIIAKFLKFINDYNPRLVSFNGRGFDLPMIMVRAMRYNLSVPAYFESENRELNKNKWENYRSRYSSRFHLDLLDHISDFGAVRGLKLDTLCASLNLPGKYDVHGDQVLELYYANELIKINEYCESDVLNTYWLFLKFELLQGNITLDDYASFLSVMSEFLSTSCTHRGYSFVFCESVELELARIGGELSYEESGGYGDEVDVSQSFESENLDTNEPLLTHKQSIDELNKSLVKSGLGGLLQKGSQINLKQKERVKIKDDGLPEINLD